MSSRETVRSPDFGRSASFSMLVATFCVIVVISNVAAIKPVQVGSGSLSWGPLQLWPLILDGGAVLFPLSYVIGDIVAEVYGLRASRRAVVAGFLAAVLAAATFTIVAALPVVQGAEVQGDLFSDTLGPVPRIVSASLLAFAAGQMLNAFVVVRMKARRAGGGLLTRLVSSSLVGQSVDTLIFCSIAASAIGISGGGAFLNYFVVGVVFKLSVEIAVLPVTVWAIAKVRQVDQRAVQREVGGIV